MTTQSRQSRARGRMESGVLDALNHHVAVAADLRAQIKQAHWTVIGPNFIAIHRLFDEQAEIMTEHIDLFAERMRSLQAIPRGLLSDAIAESGLSQIEVRELPEEEAIRAILERLETYSRSLTEAIQQCDQAEDLSTQDLFIDAQRQADQQCYLLRSHLPGRVIARGRGAPSRDSAHQDGHR